MGYTQVNLRVRAESVARWKAAARAQDRSLSSLVRVAVDREIARREKKSKQ